MEALKAFSKFARKRRVAAKLLDIEYPYHSPAIDPIRSLSRVMSRVTETSHRDAARAALEHLAVYEAKRDLVLLGAYEPGSDRALDAALSRIDALEAFLRQRPDETSSLEQTLSQLRAALA